MSKIMSDMTIHVTAPADSTDWTVEVYEDGKHEQPIWAKSGPDLGAVLPNADTMVTWMAMASGPEDEGRCAVCQEPQQYCLGGHATAVSMLADADSGDPWGEVMGTLFFIAECVWVFEGERLEGFNPSPMMLVGDFESLDEVAMMMVQDYGIDQMKQAYPDLIRVRDRLVAQGRDY